MTERSPRMDWAYPSRNDDPWYDGFQDFIISADGSSFAHREDRSIIWSGGGIISWSLATQTFTWTGTINVYSPLSAKLMQITASSVTGWADGEVVYIDLTRLVLTNTAKTFQKASILPSTDDAMAFGIRIGSVIYLRTGLSLGDGDSISGVAPVPAASSMLEIEDEGVSVDADVVNIDFIGRGVIATQTSAQYVRIDVPGESLEFIYDVVYSVDYRNTDPSPDGSKNNPFTSISDAMTAIGNPVDAADEERNFLVYVVAGPYASGFTIPAARNIHFMLIGNYCSGPVQFTGGITWNIDSTAEFSAGYFSVRFLSVDPMATSINRGAGARSWQATQFSTNVLNSSASAFELILEGVNILGGFTFGEAAWGGYIFYNHGLVTGAVNIYGNQVFNKVQFNAAVTLEKYTRIQECMFFNSVTLTGTYEWQPGSYGFVDCEFSGAAAITFPVGELFMDGASIANALAAGRTLPATVNVLEKSLQGFNAGSALGYFNKINVTGSATASNDAGTLKIDVTGGGGIDEGAVTELVMATMA